MLFQSFLFAATIFSAGALATPKNTKVYKHVAMFSVDGLHSSDVAKYVAKNPNGAIASLLKTGYEYQDALTSAPSDSFPGTLNQYTGASPRTHGVWYDDIYDRTYYDPFSVSGKRCVGAPGAEVAYAENLDYDNTQLFSGGINPDNLPQAIVNGECKLIYPHNRLRVNTIMEIVSSKGKKTAYADKHPAYDLLRGPSGNGLSVGYFPEITAAPNTVDGTITYDELHVDAFLQWIDGQTPANSQGSLAGVTPTLFGGNFQSVSVAQKTKGYLTNLDFTPDLLKALDFVDASLGKVVAALKKKGIYEDTLIVVASKHGQTPIDPKLYNKLDPAAVTNATGVPVTWQTSDDIALIFLKNQADVDEAVENLNRHRPELKIEDIVSKNRLQTLGYGNPLEDPAVPDIIVAPELGTIYTTSNSKIAEHGGVSRDDRQVACFISSPGLVARKYPHQVSTRQVAPTVLRALGLDPSELRGAVIEETQPLPGF
jgi:predicted AlkP superfamily pyrophosphatase or phosphodiesterase